MLFFIFLNLVSFRDCLQIVFLYHENRNALHIYGAKNYDNVVIKHGEVLLHFAHCEQILSLTVIISSQQDISFHALTTRTVE